VRNGAGDQGRSGSLDKISRLRENKGEFLVGNRLLRITSGLGKRNYMISPLYAGNVAAYIEHHPGTVKTGSEWRGLPQVVVSEAGFDIGEIYACATHFDQDFAIFGDQIR
jgi:hypothetical protein